MVKRLLQLIGKEISGLHEAAYLLGAFALVSQLLALLRDRLLAGNFGASHQLDIYYAAFRIPDFIFVSIASMVSLSVLIPFLMEKLDSGEKEAKEFIDSLFSVFFFIIGAVAVIIWFFTPQLLKIFFPSFQADFPTLISMTRIMLLSPIFLGFSNFLASVTQIYKRFFIYALSPVFYNLGIIFGVVVLSPIVGIQGLAWGVAIGAFLHCFIQIPFVMHKSLFPRFAIPINFSLVKKVVFVSLPRTITLSSNEIAEFFLVAMAGTLAPGSISIFNFSWNLQSVPLSVIGVSYSLAAFPVLTRLFTSGEQKKFFEYMVVSTKHMLFWLLPVTALFIVLRAHIVRVILGSGDFDWVATRLTAAALALFVISLVAQSLTTLFVRAYYSRGDTKKPLLMNIISALGVILFSYLAIYFFKQSEAFRHTIGILLRVDDVPGTIVLMLPLGFSLGAILNMLIHWVAFELDFPGFTKNILTSGLQFLFSSIVLGFVTYLFLALFQGFFNLSTLLGIFSLGLLAGMAGIMVYCTLLLLTRNKEIIQISQTLHRKIWQAKVVPPDPSGV